MVTVVIASEDTKTISVAMLPTKVIVAPLWKLLPNIATGVPPDAGPEVGLIDVTTRGAVARNGDQEGSESVAVLFVSCVWFVPSAFIT